MESFGNVYYAGDPMRVPEWRWLRATQLLQPGAEVVPDDDRWVLRLYRYLKDRNRLCAEHLPGSAGMHKGFRRLQKQHGVLHDVVRTHEEGVSMKYMLSALLMVRDQSIPELAAVINKTPQFLQTYEALYFDIRSRLRDIGYIMTTILSPMGHDTGTGAGDRDVTWKALAYMMGAEMFLRVAFGTGEMPKEIYDRLQNSIRGILASRGYLGALGRGMNNYTTHEALQELAALESAAASKTDSTDKATAEQMAETFRSMQYSVYSVADVPVPELVDKVERRVAMDLKLLAEGQEDQECDT
jgi:hypothetical protein